MQRIQNLRGNQTTKGLRNRIRRTNRRRWVSLAHLRCLIKTSVKIACEGLHSAVL